LIKHKDAAVDPAWNIEEHEGSALTGRTLEEIGEESPPNAARVRSGGRSAWCAKKRDAIAARTYAGDAHQPSVLRPQLALRNQMGRGSSAGVDRRRKLELRSRAGGDITKQYRSWPLFRDMSAARAILDGEIVVWMRAGIAIRGLAGTDARARAFPTLLRKPL